MLLFGGNVFLQNHLQEGMNEQSLNKTISTADSASAAKYLPNHTHSTDHI